MLRTFSLFLLFFFKMTSAVFFFLSVNPLNFPVSTSKKVDWPIFWDFKENLVYKFGLLSVMLRSDCKCEAVSARATFSRYSTTNERT